MTQIENTDHRVPAPGLAIGELPDGWSRESWMIHCRAMAKRCRGYRSDIADQWDARAEAMRREENGD